MITLRNVIDIRTGKFHSTVRVKERMAKYFEFVNNANDNET